MFGLNKIEIINERESLIEQRENIENELYNLVLSIGGRNATYEELQEEVRLRKEISLCEYKIQHLNDELHSIFAIKAGIFSIGLIAAITLLLAASECSKENKKESSIEYSKPISITDMDNGIKYVAPEGFIIENKDGQLYCYKGKKLIKSLD